MWSSRGKLVAAVAISLALHAVGGLAWLAGRGDGPGGATGFDPRVEAPADDKFSVTLLDPPKREFVVPSQNKPPAPLPPTVAVPPPPGPGPGPVVPAVHTPESPAASPPPSRPSRIFGGKPPTGTVVFVLDRSSSMGVDGLLPRAVAETLTAIEQLAADTRFQVVAYNGGAMTAPGETLQPNPETLARIARWLKALPAEGKSDHRAGIREALTFRPTHVFLLTDADDLDAREANYLNGLLRGPIVMNALVVGPAGTRPAVETPLEGLTRAHGGRVRYLEP